LPDKYSSSRFEDVLVAHAVGSGPLMLLNDRSSTFSCGGKAVGKEPLMLLLDRFNSCTGTATAPAINPCLAMAAYKSCWVNWMAVEVLL
jgi:hypothetical protein